MGLAAIAAQAEVAGEKFPFLGGKLFDQRQGCLTAGADKRGAPLRKCIDGGFNPGRIVRLGFQGGREGHHLLARGLAAIAEILAETLEHLQQFVPAARAQFAEELARDVLSTPPAT